MVKLRGEIHMRKLMILIWLVLTNCSNKVEENNYNYAVEKTVLYNNCAELKGFDGLIIDKTTSQEALKTKRIVKGHSEELIDLDKDFNDWIDDNARDINIRVRLLLRSQMDMRFTYPPLI